MNFDTFNSIKDDANLKVSEKYFYTILVNYASEKGYAYPNYKQLKKDMRTARNDTISNLVQSLVNKGYIKYDKGNSFKNSNRYYPLKHMPSMKKEPSTEREHNTSTKIEHSTSTKTEHLKKNQKRKENKNDNNKGYDTVIDDYTENQELRSALLSFIKMRKAIKADMTDKALELMLKKLDKLGKDNKNKIEILEKSIMNSWKGIFELKETQQATTSAKYKEFGKPY